MCIVLEKNKGKHISKIGKKENERKIQYLDSFFKI